MSKIKKISSIGTLLSIFCCLLKPSLVAFVAGLGIVFSVGDDSLAVFILLFTSIFFISIFHSFRGHGNMQPLLLSALGITMVILFRFLWSDSLIAGMGGVFILFAAVWDLHLVKGCQC
ncbi:MAG: hypothetical protein G01um101418_505 [Parcubacteria group bacterium Gr01-1014_18]|nr:MAG: hypothetical protein Greene041636_551 [Parcubacteria group bacterium Greene0416_36]TSC80968.1 MAG: hypothetical protein G01um101418_505 [Parcubacteria group bacterium Gr01-1014_18]TSC98855.1 MAG: hypothetical protein Greene101420_488 [Parcubacteria group bacterium Greene1014_20]TSD06559.1 MAG: hypothetical protein Greene07142_834 [Parcubacteria group bacterium Greene0714_2]